MKTRIYLLSQFVLLFAGVLCGQKLNTAKLDSLFLVLEENNQAMGSVAISKDGKLVYQKAIGFSTTSETERIPATIQTKYRIGSITKMYTAIMIFQLIEEKKITLETTVDTFFPGLPMAAEMTISHLLNHRSGLHNFTNDAAYMNYCEMPKTEEEMVAIITKGGSDFDPDSKGEYSNSNYVVLGYIIEKATGMSYASNLESRITSKLKLEETYVGSKIAQDNFEAYSYLNTGQWSDYTETDMSIPGGAGAIVSTPTDMVKVIEGLFEGKLISEKSLLQMKTIKEGYGMGMFQIPFYQRSGYGHNGSIDAFTASLSYFPDDKLAVAYCTNGQVYPMNEILVGVLSVAFDRDFAIPSFKTITLTSEQLDPYLGVYSSPSFPLKLTVTKEGTALFAQATGQMAIPLEATAIDKFKFDPAGILISFDRDKNELTLKQGGGSYVFSKE